MAALETFVKLQTANRGFINNATGSNVSTGETIVAAVSGKSHYVTSITINCVDDITIWIQDNTATPVVLLGPVHLGSVAVDETLGNSSYTIVYPNAIKVAAGKLIEVDASGAGPVNIVIQGYTE